MRFDEAVAGNPYPGRGLLLGTTPDGSCSVLAYFLMGRSVNSRNRVLKMVGEDLMTQAKDPSKLSDPSLILYEPVHTLEDVVIVGNGDQTDTVRDALQKGGSFSGALEKRAFEPDAPNYTPRITGVVRIADGAVQLSILCCPSGDGVHCERRQYDYAAEPGTARLLHTYRDGRPELPFAGEPVAVETEDDINAFAQRIWDALDADNRISLYVRYTRIGDGGYTDVLINQY